MRARRCVPFGPDVGDYAGVLTPEHDTNQGSSSARQARQRLPSHILLQRPGDEWIPLRENSFSMPLEPFQSGPLPLMVSALFVLLVGTKPDLHSSSPPAALNAGNVDNEGLIGREREDHRIGFRRGPSSGATKPT